MESPACVRRRVEDGLSERQNHGAVALIADGSLLASSLTVGALITLAALDFGLFIDSMLLGVSGVIVAVGVTVVGSALGFAVACPLAIPRLQDAFARVPASLGPSGRARRLMVLAGMIVVDATAMRALSAVLPFRFGLPSCLYYCLPAVLLACLAAPRSRGRLLLFGAVLTAGAALVLPVRAFQTRIAAQQWLGDSGVSSREQAQVVVLPGLVQEPYTFDGRTLIAQFSSTPSRTG